MGLTTCSRLRWTGRPRTDRCNSHFQRRIAVTERPMTDARATVCRINSWHTAASAFDPRVLLSPNAIGETNSADYSTNFATGIEITANWRRCRRRRGIRGSDDNAVPNLLDCAMQSPAWSLLGRASTRVTLTETV